MAAALNAPSAGYDPHAPLSPRRTPNPDEYDPESNYLLPRRGARVVYKISRDKWLKQEPEIFQAIRHLARIKEKINWPATLYVEVFEARLVFFENLKNFDDRRSFFLISAKSAGAAFPILRALVRSTAVPM